MRVFLSILAVFWLMVALPASASTLDPSHPVWDLPAPRVEAWANALRELAADRAPELRWHEELAARGKAAAVGVRVLVIPVLPTDAPSPPRSREQLQALWTERVESSVRGYWDYVSGGQLDLQVDVLPWLDVPGSLQSDYPNVINGNPANLTAGPRNLARDAVAAAAELIGDLHVYDDDGPDGVPGSGDDDGILDLVVVLHPFEGWETNPIDVPRAIVSVQASLNREDIPGSDLKADGFIVCSAQGPLGVWVHEFGHLLGLPDLYDLDRNPVSGTPGGVGPQGGLGRWSLMASGTWGGDGATPSGLDPWSRSTLGFGEEELSHGPGLAALEWVDATQAMSVRLSPLGQWEGETFLVEARRPRPGAVVDAALPGQGALVYRLRPDLSSNKIAEGFLQLLQADGLDDLQTGANDGDAGDPWRSGRLDGLSTPSSQSSSPSPLRTPPVFEFNEAAAGMQVQIELSAIASVRLDSFQFVDPVGETRSWLRPGESLPLRLSWAQVGEIPAAGLSVEILVRPEGRALEVQPAGAVDLVLDGDHYVPVQPLSIADIEGTTSRGEGLLELVLRVNGAVERIVEVGVPVAFGAGLAPDALARFQQEIVQADGDTTRFRRLEIADLPQPAFVGYELETNGQPGYANSVEVKLDGEWFARPDSGRVWLWARGSTEEGLPGQVFDGAALEVFVPDQGWLALEAAGDHRVWINRRSAAGTRDRWGIGGALADWTSFSFVLPQPALPMRVRVRFASNSSIPGPRFEIAGLETAQLPTATVNVDSDRNTKPIATAVLSGDFSRVNLAGYRWRASSDDPWQLASGIFSVSGTGVFNAVLTLLPDDVDRARIGLFSGLGDNAFLIGETGFRRDGPAQMPSLVQNPAQGSVVMQVPDQSESFSMGVFDLRGRRVSSIVIPARTPWLEWVPSDERGRVLASGQYFLRADEMDLPVVRFIWFR